MYVFLLPITMGNNFCNLIASLDKVFFFQKWNQLLKLNTEMCICHAKFGKDTFMLKYKSCSYRRELFLLAVLINPSALRTAKTL